MKMQKKILKSVVLLGVLLGILGEMYFMSSNLKYGTVYALTNREVIVYPKDFLYFFQRNGSAENFEYDTNSFIQTLTPDQPSQSGNVTLKTKVDMSQNFSFTGLINLGNKGMKRGGADGVGFLFHPGNTNIVGTPGGGAGIGGVSGAFGFKLDTYYNNWNDPSFIADPPQFSSGQSFGAFVNGLNGQAKTIAESAKAISEPSSNNFVPFFITYEGQTKTMTITYGNQTWSQDVSPFIVDEKAMSFSIAASTGANTNLQQLKNVQFSYTIAQGEVITNYIDEDGNSISSSSIMNGDLDTNYETNQKEIQGYTFKEVTGSPTKGKYKANDQTINYIYSPNRGDIKVIYTDDTIGQNLSSKELSGRVGQDVNYSTQEDITSYKDMGYELVSDDYPPKGVTFGDGSQEFFVHLRHGKSIGTEQKKINETIHYLYENKTEALPSYVANPLLFSRAIITDNVTGDKTFGEWKAEQENEFNEVKSPDVKGYTPDQKLIEKIEGITAETQDITKSVIYKRNQGQIIITYIDDTTGKTLDIDELSGLTDDNTDYTTLDKISLYEKMGDNLVSNDFPTDGTKFKDNEQYYVVHLSHGLKTVVEEKKVNQTIHYVYKDGSKAVSDFNAIPKLFTRTIIIDKVTGEKTIGKWTAKMGNSFEKILSPIIKGYKPDKLLIPEVKNITEDTEDIEDTVTYSKNTPDDDTVPITTPLGDDMVPPITPRGIIIPPVTPPNNLIINNKNNSKKVINWTDLSNDRLLPSTGDDQKSQKYLGVLGSLLLGISAILIFMKRKNK